MKEPGDNLSPGSFLLSPWINRVQTQLWITNERRESMIYSCSEHVEEALDETLTDGGPPPVFTKMEDKEAPCFICGKPALFQVEA